MAQTMYEAPSGITDFGERTTDGKKLILYISEVAFVDVIEIESIMGGQEILGELLLRVEAPPDKAMDLLRHTPVYASPEDAERVFGRTKLSAEDLENMFG